MLLKGAVNLGRSLTLKKKILNFVSVEKSTAEVCKIASKMLSLLKIRGGAFEMPIKYRSTIVMSKSKQITLDEYGAYVY